MMGLGGKPKPKDFVGCLAELAEPPELGWFAGIGFPATC
jgi:hypothetical protein